MESPYGLWGTDLDDLPREQIMSEEAHIGPRVSLKSDVIFGTLIIRTKFSFPYPFEKPERTYFDLVTPSHTSDTGTDKSGSSLEQLIIHATPPTTAPSSPNSSQLCPPDGERSFQDQAQQTDLSDVAGPYAAIFHPFIHPSSPPSADLEPTGEPESLDETISRHRAATVLCLDRLSDSLCARFKDTGDRNDLEEAIKHWRESLELRPTSDPGHSNSFLDMAESLCSQFQHTGRLEDVDAATQCYRVLLEFYPDGHPDHARSLGGLAASFQARFKQTGSPEDLDGAIESHRASLALHHPENPTHTSILNSLVANFRSRFKLTWDTEDLDRAIGFARALLRIHLPGDADHAVVWENLREVLYQRFKQTGKLKDLGDVIEWTAHSLQLHPPDDPQCAGHLKNLAGVLHPHLQQAVGDDLVEAIRVFRTAHSLFPVGHPDGWNASKSLATLLSLQVEQSKAGGDVEAAIEHNRTDLVLSPADPHSLQRTVMALYRRKRAEDLDEAVSCTSAALGDLPDDDPRISPFLNNLAIALGVRYAKAGNLKDLNESVTWSLAGLQVDPQDESQRLQHVRTIAITTSALFRQTEDAGHLDQAIDMTRQYLKCYPPGHPDRAPILENLSTLLHTRSGRTKTVGSPREALVDLLTQLQNLCVEIMVVSWKRGQDPGTGTEQRLAIIEGLRTSTVFQNVLLGNHTDRSIEAAVQMLKNMDKMAISAVFRSRADEVSKALVIASEPVPVPLDMPRGLNQLRNTCYLNSLLQYFYTIKDLRDAVTSLSAVDADVQDLGRVGGRLTTRGEIARARQFVKQLAQLFSALETSEESAVSPSFELAQLALPNSSEQEGGSSSFDNANMTRFFDATRLTSTPESMYSSPTSSSLAGSRPRGMSFRSGGAAMAFGMQHDVAECMGWCLFQLECAGVMRPSDVSEGSEEEQLGIVKRLFYGTTRQRILPASGAGSRHSIHEKDDLFSDLAVNVSEGGFDIYDGLSCYFVDNNVEFEGTAARMETSLVDLPPLLHIRLQRVQFHQGQQEAFKSQAYVSFTETITMDRFLENADPEKKARSHELQEQLAQSRKRMKKFKKTTLAQFEVELQLTEDFLDRPRCRQLGDDILSEVAAESNSCKSELERERDHAANLKQELEDLWSDERSALYELASVFVHRGTSASSGHYFLYSRNLPDRPDEWFKYDDSVVTWVSKAEVLRDTTGEDENSYLLVFARKGSDVIQTVNRVHVSHSPADAI